MELHHAFLSLCFLWYRVAGAELFNCAVISAASRRDKTGLSIRGASCWQLISVEKYNSTISLWTLLCVDKSQLVQTYA